MDTSIQAMRFRFTTPAKSLMRESRTSPFTEGNLLDWLKERWLFDERGRRDGRHSDQLFEEIATGGRMALKVVVEVPENFTGLCLQRRERFAPLRQFF